MKSSRIQQTLALGAAMLALSIGGAFAATTADVSTNVMSGPGTNFKTVASIKAGADVNVSRHSGSWCRISSPATGWVPCGDLDSPAKTTAAATPASTGWHGYEYQNDPYLGPAGIASLHHWSNGSFD
jgi:uncharacterized protein YgiM (DUF1202 family)